MILLAKGTLTILDRFQVESMALNLEERNSTATITVGPEAPEIAINDWLKDETEPGAGIIWRVKTVTEQVDTKTRTIQLEHVIQILKDTVLFGETKPGTMAGNNSAAKCTARQAITWALQGQSLWQLGDLSENPSNPYSFNGDTRYAAIETVTGSLDEAQWEYDLTRIPFTLHIRKAPEAFSSEMRMSRNIQTLRKQIDRSRMYTRIYPIGKNNIHIDGDYLEKNTATWGVVCKVETDQSQETKDELKRWAQERLNRHCEPLVTITVAGLDMSADTGEPLDHIVIGRKCRVPLPEYSTTILEKVTKLSWADKIKEPKKLTVTLANLVEDVASIVNTLASSTSKSGRTGAKKAGEDHAWFLDTTTHVGMVAEAVAGPGAAEDWSRVSSVIVDGMGIHQRVVRTEGEIVAAWAAIEVLDDKIDMEVANAKSDMYAHVEITASHIRSEVSASKSTLFSVIMQTATNIYTQVGNAKSDTYSKIEETASSVRSDIWAAKSTLFSSIMQTATNIYTQVGNAKSDTYSKIEETASSVRSDIWAAKSTLFSSIMQTATNIYTQVGNAKSDTYSKIEQTASSIESTVASAKSSLYSSIMQTSTNIYVQVASAKSDLSAAIDVQANKISLVVSGTGNNAKIKAAQIVTAINDAGSTVLISADKILLDGSTTVAGMLTVQDGALYVKNDLVVATSGKISVKTINMQNNGSISFPDPGGNVGTMTLNNGNIANFFTALKVVASGNNYKLQYKSMSVANWTDLPDSTFSRAVSSWVWGGGSGKINVTALPQNQTKSINVSIDGQNSITANGTYTYTVDYENGDGDDVSTGATKTVTVSIKSAADYYNASSYWKKPKDNNGVCTVPNIGVTAAETWFTMSKISITRASWHSVSGNVYKGKLYYWDDDDESYSPVVNSNKYWYYSDSSVSGTTTVYY